MHWKSFLSTDDNCLSLDEFKSFFGDGILTMEELEELFHKIDTHNTGNIDIGELCGQYPIYRRWGDKTLYLKIQ